jgi:hypothetical protein
MNINLKLWKIGFKVGNAIDESPGLGPKDPFADETLFTVDTHKVC